MKILVDGLTYFFHKGELGENTKNIIDVLAEFDNLNMYITQDEFDIDIATPNKLKIIKIKTDRFSDEFKFDTRKKFDIFHCFNNGFYINNNIKAKRVFNITTLLPLIDENLCSVHYKTRFMKRIYDAVNFSHAIIVSSEYQKNILTKYFESSTRKIHVLYPTISETYKKATSKLPKIYLKSKFMITEEFMLFSADIHRKKNIEDILFFFKILIEKNKTFKLVLALTFIHNNSYEIDYITELKNLAFLLNISNYIVFIENPSRIDSLNLFATASKYIDLSLSDDFNLSIIKAFLCDIDIICTQTDLHKELLGEYPSYYNFDEDLIPSLVEKSKPLEEKEQFDYLRDNFRGDFSYRKLSEIYLNLKR